MGEVGNLEPARTSISALGCEQAEPTTKSKEPTFLFLSKVICKTFGVCLYGSHLMRNRTRKHYLFPLKSYRYLFIGEET